MKLTWFFFVSVLIVLSGFLACVQGEGLVSIGEEDGDKEFVVDKGTKIVVSLDTDTNPGYRWVLDEYRDDLLILETEDFQEGVDGASGKQLFNFTAKVSPVGGGQTPVNFSYKDLSGQAVDPVKKLHFTILVRQD